MTAVFKNPNWLPKQPHPKIFGGASKKKKRKRRKSKAYLIITIFFCRISYLDVSSKTNHFWLLWFLFQRQVMKKKREVKYNKNSIIYIFVTITTKKPLRSPTTLK